MKKATYITLGVLVLFGIVTFLIINSNKNMTANNGMQNSQNMMAQNGDIVSVKYTGKLTNGTVFDATANHGDKPIDFQLGVGQVIKGWDQGILGMKIGDKKTLTIPPELGYGDQEIPDGRGGILIPKNSTLIFDVELVDIKRP
jgi:FK506-binding protein 2